MPRSLFLFTIILSCTFLCNINLASSFNNDKIKQFTSEMTKFDGFFRFYYDNKEDRIYLEISEFDTEFLFVQGLSSGIGSNDIGLDRNQLGRERIVKFVKNGPKILLLQPNYTFRGTSDNPDEVNSIKDAFAQSVLWGFKEVVNDENTVLIEITDFLLSDAHRVSEKLRRKNQGKYSVDKSRSAIYLPKTKNFPENSEFETMLTYKGTNPGAYIKSVTPTASSVTIRQHFSFIKLPNNNYKPRRFDPRSGFNAMTFYDYTTPINEETEQKYIFRHRLEKKNPKLALSEAKTPIVYYLDRGTPEPVKSALIEGASWWNEAFESAGFKNAFQVKLLPKDADPMDVRYNVINWVHRSTRGWSYGGSIHDPRTGEIIKGHVLLGSLRVRQDYLIAESILSPYNSSSDISPEMTNMALARLRQLSAHEIGHTLGLAHSYTSSTENRASVMDYPHPMISLKNGKIDITHAYDNKIGDWDKVSITYGYKEFFKGTNEKEALQNIIQNSIKNKLTFLSDQDARPIESAHPYAHLWDNGKSPEQELAHLLEVRKIALQNFGENNIKVGEPFAKLEEVLVPLYFLHRYQVEATTKLIGGLNYRYAIRGDGQLQTEFVPSIKQKEALKILIKSLDNNTLTLSENIIKLIPPRPIGYTRGRELAKIRTGITFDPIAMAETAASMVLKMLLNPARMQRVIEFHARDKSQPSLEYIINQLIENTVDRNRESNLEGEVGRAVDQVFVSQLVRLAADDKTGEQVRAIAIMKLKEISDKLSKRTSNNYEQKSHFESIIRKINTFLKNPNDYKSSKSLVPPDGSPIGMKMNEISCENMHHFTQKE